MLQDAPAKDVTTTTRSRRTLNGRYALGGLLGRGGMADVHRAEDVVLDREVAVKILSTATQEPGDEERFALEALTLARLSHPHLVAVFDVGTEDGVPYLVLELVDGGNLREVLRSGPLPASRVIDLGVQLADALAQVHVAGVVHRDIKPSNVLLAEDGSAKLADFSVARLLSHDTRHTATGVTVGTAAYLAPEQVGGEEVSTAADVYSLGLLLLEALTGEQAYPGPPVEAAMARLSSPPRVPEWLGPEWEDLLRSMTDLDPASRPTSRQVVRRLSQMRAGRDARRAGPSPDGDSTVRTPMLPRAPHVPPPGAPLAPLGASAAGESVARPSAMYAAWARLRVAAASSGFERTVLAAAGAVLLALGATTLSAATSGGSPSGAATSESPRQDRAAVATLRAASDRAEGQRILASTGSVASPSAARASQGRAMPKAVAERSEAAHPPHAGRSADAATADGPAGGSAAQGSPAHGSPAQGSPARGAPAEADVPREGQTQPGQPSQPGHAESHETSEPGNGKGPRGHGNGR